MCIWSWLITRKGGAGHNSNSPHSTQEHIGCWNLSFKDVLNDHGRDGLTLPVLQNLVGPSMQLKGHQQIPRPSLPENPAMTTFLLLLPDFCDHVETFMLQKNTFYLVVNWDPPPAGSHEVRAVIERMLKEAVYKEEETGAGEAKAFE